MKKVREFKVGDKVTHLIFGNCEVTDVSQDSLLIINDGMRHCTYFNGYTYHICSEKKEAPPIMFHGHDVTIKVVPEDEKIPSRTVTWYVNLYCTDGRVRVSTLFKSYNKAAAMADAGDVKVGVPIELPE